jgi:hypothetical protein
LLLGSSIIFLNGSVAIHLGTVLILLYRSVVVHLGSVVLLLGLIAVLLSRDILLRRGDCVGNGGIVVLYLDTLPLILLCRTLMICFKGFDVDRIFNSPICGQRLSTETLDRRTYLERFS